MCLLLHGHYVRYSHRSHIDYAAHGGARGQDVRWFGDAEQYGADGDAAASAAF